MIGKSAIFYIFFLLFFVAFSYLFVDYNIPYFKNLYTGFYTDHRIIVSLIYIFFILIFFSFYVFFLNKIGKFQNLKLLILISAAILLFSYPAILSYDIFNYLTTSKIAFFYRENPYLFTPLQFPSDPFLQFTRATNKIALYGPFWILISIIPWVLGMGNFFATLLGFKIIAALSYFGSSILIYKISRSQVSTAIFSLNPLVITESLVSGHNDIFMMFLSLLAFYFLSKDARFKSLFSLFLSVLIKYATLFLTPIFLFEFFKNKKNNKIIYLTSFLAMFIVFLLSPIREEIYPWYAIWFLIFVPMIYQKKLRFLTLGISLGLMLSYVPFMWTGTYFDSTPYLKYTLVIIPSALSIMLPLERVLWLKNFLS